MPIPIIDTEKRLDPTEIKERIVTGLRLAGVDPEAFDIHPTTRFALVGENIGTVFPVYLAVAKSNGMVFMFAALGAYGIEEE